MDKKDNSPEKNEPKTEKKVEPTYQFGGLREFSLEQIENEVLSESVYLDVFAGSDLRLKADVHEMPATLHKLDQLDAILYQWNPEVNPQQPKASGQQVGLIAQQVAEIFPELVRQDENSGYLAVNYSKLTTHLLVAVKELSALCREQNRRLTDLEKKLPQ